MIQNDRIHLKSQWYIQFKKAKTNNNNKNNATSIYMWGISVMQHTTFDQCGFPLTLLTQKLKKKINVLWCVFFKMLKITMLEPHNIILTTAQFIVYTSRFLLIGYAGLIWCSIAEATTVRLPLRVLWRYSVTVGAEYLYSTLNSTPTCSIHSGTA